MVFLYFGLQTEMFTQALHFDTCHTYMFKLCLPFTFIRSSGKPCRGGSREVSFGTQIQYECDPGYSLYGPSTITCEEDGKWSLTPPFCEVSKYLTVNDIIIFTFFS